jgi:MFS transporter, MHS family, proline/betaine transporter
MKLAGVAEPIAGRSSLRIVAAASIGNALEWFDLLIYGYFSAVLSK